MDDIDSYFDDLGLLPEMTVSHEVSGGHMAYHRTVYTNDSEHIFIKKCKDIPGMSDQQKKHALSYLEKEFSIINQLSTQDYIPEFAELRNNALIMPAYLPSHGWHWQIPQDTDARLNYIQHILKVLSEKENLQIDYTHADIEDTVQTLQLNGWEKLTQQPDLLAAIQNAYQKFKDKLQPDSQILATSLLDNITKLAAEYRPIKDTQLTAFSHHDARINNIAWQTNGQLRIVDWSWAGMGLPLSDSTMFLIDLAKNGVDISDYVDGYFSDKHAFILTGYWLARSLEPSSHNPEVRLHQFASAISAYSLLK